MQRINGTAVICPKLTEEFPFETIEFKRKPIITEDVIVVDVDLRLIPKYIGIKLKPAHIIESEITDGIVFNISDSLTGGSKKCKIGFK